VLMVGFLLKRLIMHGMNIKLFIVTIVLEVEFFIKNLKNFLKLI
jgi:hypothetical protein